MKQMKIFKSEAIKRGLCAQYTQKWGNCESKKQLFDLAMDSNGIPYICDAIASGWGISAEYIKDKFRAFINGKYKSEQNGYDSMMYVETDDTFTVDATNVVVVSSHCDLELKNNQIFNLFCVNSSVDIIGKGEVYVYEYGECCIRPSLETKIVTREKH